MSPRNEDFLFVQEAQRQGFVTETQVEEGFRLQHRMLDELQLDERIAVILVKRGWLAEEQARRVYARLDPKGGPDEIAGYEIVEKIGRGAMGTVYKAIHKGLDKPVAIKILRSDLARETIHVERLKEEAKLLASLDHPNIVRALDAGEAGGFPFVVMEYVEGESVKDRVARRGPMREVDALKITRPIADALERARRMGVVHRDVKPGNILLSRQGEPKLMDLGLAKGPVDLGLTQHGTTVGTPQYISPEQAQDPRRADTRSDIYSLGATLYAMLTGRPPFTGSTLAEVLTKVLYEEPTPIRVLAKGVSPDAAYLVERMMLKDPGLRYRTPEAVVRDIDAILAGRSIIPAGFRGNWEAHLLRRRLQRWTRLGAAGVLALLLLVGGVVYLREETERRRAFEEGSQAVREALVETEVQPTDELALVQQRLADARAVLERHRAAEPRGLADLVARLAFLERELAWFEGFENTERPEVQRLVGARRWGPAVERLDRYQRTISNPQSPVRRAVRDLVGDVVTDSVGQLVELQAARRLAAFHDLEGALAWCRAHAEAVAAPFVQRPDLLEARELAARAVQALEAVLRRMTSIEAAFASDALAPRLAAMDLAGLSRDLDAARREATAFADAEWGPLEAAGFGRRGDMRALVKSRLDVLEVALDAAVERTAEETLERATALASQGRGADGLALLAEWRDTASSGGYTALARRADAAYRALEDRQRTTQVRAAEDLDILLDEVRRLVREGRPEAIRERRDALLAAVGATWPYRADVERLGDVADALAAFLGRAMDGLERVRRVEDVRLRDGTVERKWVVEEVDRAARRVTVTSPSRSGREGRDLAEVDPVQLAEWAALVEPPPAPAQRAVALLMAIDERVPDDLRPRRGQLEELVAALEAAGWGGELAARAQRDRDDVEIQQRKREESAREEHEAAGISIARREYETAYWHLERLLRPGNPFQKTDAFEARAEELRRDLAAVLAEIDNKQLAEGFPAARIRTEGGRTAIAYDFESYAQLEVFRSGEGRACGALEPYANPRTVTPGSASQRLHLLRGVEGLDRDGRLVLPSIMDPAAPMEVSFTLFTLQSPFFLGIDLDGLQVAIASADPASPAWRQLWQFPEDVPLLAGEKARPVVDGYGRGRGVAFHAGKGFGDPADPTAWDWPVAGAGSRALDGVRDVRQQGLAERLFCFLPDEVYAVRVVREPGRLALYVNDRLVAREEREEWRKIGQDSDTVRGFYGGSGLVQIWTWTPQAIDDLQVTGVVLERWR